MGDHQRGVVAAHLAQVPPDFAFGLGIQRAGRLVEHRDGRIFQNGACDRHPLLSPPDSFSPRSPTRVS